MPRTGTGRLIAEKLKELARWRNGTWADRRRAWTAQPDVALTAAEFCPFGMATRDEHD